MAGAGINIDYQYQDQDVIGVLNHLVQTVDDMEPVFADIGEYLLLAHDERWEEQIAPSGFAWYPLDPEYEKRKKKNADLILVLDGFLRDTLTYNVTPSELEFGSNRIQAATMHFGDAERNIPERNIVGLSVDDETEILDILQDHLKAAYSP